MLEYCRREWYPEVAALARRLPYFPYLDVLLKARSGEYFPGHPYIWRKDGRIVATCTLAYLNPDDAWLHGMRVDTRCKNRGIATAFTRQLLRVAARAGRTWVGLDTPHHPYPAPVFRIAEKLGMRLEGTFAYDWYGGLAKRFPQPRPQRMAGIFDHYRMLGEPAVFLSDPGWYWARLLPGRKAWIDRFGFRLAGTPVHLVRHRHIVQGRQRYVVRTANLYDRPADFPAFLTGLLGYAVGRRHGLVIRYPAAWKDDLRRAVRGLVPNLYPGRTCRLSVSRLYGRRLTPRPTVPASSSQRGIGDPACS